MDELYKCQRCGKSVFVKFGSGRFCSRTCSNSRQFSSETNEKRSLSNKRAFEISPELRKICSDTAKKLNSSRDYSPMKGRQLSEETKAKMSAARVGKKHSEETKQKCREAQLQKVRDGTHKGWQSRNITSFAENFFINVLAKELPDASYIREKHFGKYFLDFFFEEKALDLEIDGKQHLYKERAESDKHRDEYLKNNNITVYRIPWNEINSNDGKNKMKEKIVAFIEFYNHLPVVQK